jgi:hypothetical protein
VNDVEVGRRVLAEAERELDVLIDRLFSRGVRSHRGSRVTAEEYIKAVHKVDVARRQLRAAQRERR